ncbi:hypothetical protein HX004_14450 [Myroides sp. 1354]|uniref:DUF6438 domain-containing protein n=1 Tax=unclassified Myroides TaxID=2642485 RepID=UPI0025751A00|nr:MULTISPECIES: DUF6438 domain-containing protein [unclassified Myroides]MDM1046027.1 hypothetical protein [Myroides sp. R163-1]MDM1056963.1 hypothetical protein [Myroides sp. 1354]MDM1070158.1 hypothetical protein [Myroides sp. 1372]
MGTRTILFIILTIILLGCSQRKEQQKANNQVRETLVGDWELIIDDSLVDDFPLESFRLPLGMTISKDSISFYLGFYQEKLDSLTGRRMRQFLGNTVPYQVNKDSVYIKSLVTHNWAFQWEFIAKRNDTLELATNDSTIIRYKKLTYNLDIVPDFDQIIYSSSGCYGTCPILDISVTKEGYVLFQGEGYVKSLGFYTGHLDRQTTQTIFDKFRKANPLVLENSYAVDHTDDETLTTTFIQNGKIVKTIHDYGMAGTKELIWAYMLLSNIHDVMKLDPLPYDEPFYPKLHSFSFKRDNLVLPLAKSESFYLWTALKKAKQVDKAFDSKYKLVFTDNLDYWGPDPNEARTHKYEIKSIVTDGQFYKFEFEDREAITYDLGYNFLERNFNTANFIKDLER